MLYKIFTSIVFISELIIGYTIILWLLKVDKAVIDANGAITAVNPKIRDIGYLVKKISSQLVELSYDLVDTIKRKRDDSIISQLNKILVALILFKINSKFIQNLKRSKIMRRARKALSILKLMV